MVSSLTERGGAAHQRRFCSQAGKEVHSQWLTLNETHGGDSIHQEGFRVFTQRMWHKQEDEESWDSHAVERRQREKALGPPRNHAKRPSMAYEHKSLHRWIQSKVELTHESTSRIWPYLVTFRGVLPRSRGILYPWFCSWFLTRNFLLQARPQILEFLFLKEEHNLPQSFYHNWP